MNRDSLKIILAFLGTILVVYGLPRLGLPQMSSQGVFLLLLVYAYRSRDSLFWLVWYFIVSDAPGYLFSGLYQSNLYGLPGYRLAPGFTVSFNDLFLLVFIAKSFRNKGRTGFIFKREVWLLIGMGALYIALSLALGISTQNMIRAFRFVFYWFWALVAARVICRPGDLERLFRLLLPIVLFGFILIIHTYLTNNYLHNILSGVGRFSGQEASEESYARVLFSSSIMSVALVVSIILLFRERTPIRPNTLILAVFASSLSIFLSGTRGWMLLLFLVLSSFFFIRGFGFVKQFARVSVMVGMLGLITASLFPVVVSQGEFAYDRLLTLQEFASGDLTAGGTLKRVTERGPRVMAVFRESPIIGWAFSNTFMEYSDIHVGNQTNLLNLGIFGFVLLNMAFLSILLKAWRKGRWSMIHGIGNNSHWVILLALMGFFVVHSTSTILWSLALTSVSKYLIWAFLLAIANVVLKQEPMIDDNN